MAGIVASMRYVASLAEWQMPDEVWEIEENPSASWHQAFLNTTAAAIDAIIRKGGAA
jgi:hypothetical protein